ncbi:response regulator transcription factor [Echinicola marina]|uniref:response regulator transcription factor n=1 Tax=Echinicola marina TaxID=2859768 RepID=UPI001CF6DEDB|nr:response regulator transcription factor [Echinicola marina]UCS92358.1 response regulator transcription factor [Echinicola marina]
MGKMIKIALADDEVLFRTVMKKMLEDTGDYQVLFDVGNGLELTQKLEETSKGLFPDLILMDLKMPELNGVETTKIITKKYPHLKVVALTTHQGKPFILNMLNLGAAAYITKSCSPEEMLDTLREVSHKGFYYSDEVLQVIHEDFHTKNGKNRLSMLDAGFITKREREVLLLLCKQYKTQEIAEKLFLSERTVEGHRNNLLGKTNSKNVVGLIVYGLQHGIIELSDLVDPLGFDE